MKFIYRASEENFNSMKRALSMESRAGGWLECIPKEATAVQVAFIEKYDVSEGACKELIAKLTTILVKALQDREPAAPANPPAPPAALSKTGFHLSQAQVLEGNSKGQTGNETGHGGHGGALHIPIAPTKENMQAWANIMDGNTGRDVSTYITHGVIVQLDNSFNLFPALTGWKTIAAEDRARFLAIMRQSFVTPQAQQGASSVREVCQRLRQRWPRTPAEALAAFSSIMTGLKRFPDLMDDLASTEAGMKRRLALMMDLLRKPPDGGPPPSVDDAAQRKTMVDTIQALNLPKETTPDAFWTLVIAK
jgi:hypothetical protein